MMSKPTKLWKSQLKRESLGNVIYILDAIQLETCTEAGKAVFCSADEELNTTARKLGMETAL
ncbi:MAG: hypothetical protein QW292_13015 [Candidatus Parvarchaeota archaeon]